MGASPGCLQGVTGAVPSLSGPDKGSQSQRHWIQATKSDNSFRAVRKEANLTVHDEAHATMRVNILLAALPLGAAILTTATATAAEFEQARWIAPPAGVATNFATPMFRKEFVLSRQPVRAWLRIVGLGDFDARVNGRRLADTGMNQPWSQYEKTIYYREFDISGWWARGPIAWA